MMLGVAATVRWALRAIHANQLRSWSRECRTNLKAAYTGEMARFPERDRYSENTLEVGFDPPRGNRYAYVFSTTGPVQRRDRPDPLPPDPGTITIIAADESRYGPEFGAWHALLPKTLAGGVSVGTSGHCPEACSVVVACVSNLDDDPKLDVWSVSTAKRVAPDGSEIAEGVPYHDSDDSIP